MYREYTFIDTLPKRNDSGKYTADCSRHSGDCIGITWCRHRQAVTSPKFDRLLELVDSTFMWFVLEANVALSPVHTSEVWIKLNQLVGLGVSFDIFSVGYICQPGFRLADSDWLTQLTIKTQCLLRHGMSFWNNNNGRHLLQSVIYQQIVTRSESRIGLGVIRLDLYCRLKETDTPVKATPSELTV